MNTVYFYSPLFLLVAASIFIGQISKTTQNSSDEYYLSMRQLGFFSLSFTFLAVQLGGGAIIGSAELSYRYGFFGVIYICGVSFSLLLLASGIGARLRNLNVLTIPQIFNKVYNSKKLQIAASLVLISSTFCMLLALAISCRTLFNSLGVYHDSLFIMMWIFLIYYTSHGGLKAVVNMGFLQIMFVIIVFCITTFALFVSDKLSMTEVIYQGIFDLQTGELPWFGWFLMPVLFNIVVQDIGQRCFAAKSGKTVTYAATFAGIMLLLLSLLPVTLGVIAKQHEYTFSGTEFVINLVAKLTSIEVASLFAAAILMAILSTADSVLCSLSSLINCDLLSNTRYAENIKIKKIITMAIGLAVIVFSYQSNKILNIMLLAYELAVSALFVPILMACYLDNPSKLAGKSAFIVGLVSYFVLLIFEFHHKYISLTSINFKLQAVADYRVLISISLSLFIFYIFQSKLSNLKSQVAKNTVTKKH